MKKALLLFFLFLSFAVNAQPPVVPPPIMACDDNNDGIAAFDLTSIIPTILNGSGNPATTTVTFHETLIDAQNGSTPIANPNNYVNITPSQFIHVRVFDSATNDVSLLTVNLIANPAPMANPASLFFCEGFALPIFNLQQADSTITGGLTGVFVTYHLNPNDAQTGANPLPSTYAPVTLPVQILHARVSNIITGCFSTTTLTLNVNNCDQCPVPINLSVTHLENGVVNLNWSNPPGSIISNRYIITITNTGPNSQGPLTLVANSTRTSISYVSLPNQCYSFRVQAFCTTGTLGPMSEPLEFCSVDCTNSGQCADVVILNAFLDSNNNGIKDTGEINFNQGNFVYQVNDSGNNQYGNSNSGSYYIFDTNPANSYDYSFAVNSYLSPFYSSSVTHNNVVIPAGSGSTTLYFPIVSTQAHFDAKVNVTPLGQPRPGFTHGNYISYQNLGSQTINSGTITYTKDDNVSITSISQAGTTPTANGFTYEFTNLAPFEIRYINVQLQVPTIPTVALGERVQTTAAIYIDNDSDLTNNAMTLTQPIVGSYDPNDKMESHGGKIIHEDFTSNDYLYYTIRFENTGTASAEFIRVEDLLDWQLDETTFEMISASHVVNTKRDANKLVWHFYNVDLPPTVTNPAGSHGFVHFRIKPKTGYAIGSIIPNAASIYFDYNPAIVTDVFNTEFVQRLGKPVFDFSTVSLHPNPARNEFTITNSGTQKTSKVVIYEITGKKICSISSSSENIPVDVSQFAKGMYLIELTSENDAKVTKKLIVK